MGNSRDWGLGTGDWELGKEGLNKFLPCLPPLPYLACLFFMPNAQCPIPHTQFIHHQLLIPLPIQV
ncbi:hypothetical protein FBB35_29650 [Nostoc sp. TCL240-02]|nr:hypothetical protein FBB35_29650 [Nostoc sp. TCL240-02]